MKRLATKDINYWFDSQKRKPLILRGARQVGKSTLVRQFAELRGLDLLEINIEQTRLLSLTKEGFQLTNIIQEVEVLGNRLITPKTLLFFDEIQEQPKLLSALRYFYEERPDIPVIAAGSLLDFALNESPHSVPVGRVEYYFLGPMRFSEYLEAQNESLLLEQIRTQKPKIIEAAHLRLKERYKEYLYVGGMPEAVDTFIRTKSPLEVRRVQRSIVQTYQDDFAKYAKRVQIDRLRKIFNFVPGHLGQKVKYSEIDREEKSRDLRQVLELLIQARILIPVYHTNATALPLKAQADESVYKLFFLDVGLVNCLHGTSWTSIVQAEGTELLTKGALAEQFVAQHLFYKTDGFGTPELYYWLRDKKKQNAEIDFLITENSQIVPIEVKSESSGRLKSLILFMNERQHPIAVKMDLTSYQSELVEKRVPKSDSPTVFELLNIPLYLVEYLDNLIS